MIERFLEDYDEGLRYNLAMIATMAEAATTGTRAVLSERARIARELHDGLLQDAMAIAVHLRALLPDVPALRSVVELAEQTTDETRRVIMGLRPATHAKNLVDAVRQAVCAKLANTSLVYSIVVTGAVRPIPPDIGEAVVRIVQEATSNVVRHARALRVRITLAFRGRSLRVTVVDDGIGFDPGASPGAAAGHFGLVGMRERARDLGGSFTIRSRSGVGTTVALDLPVSGHRPRWDCSFGA